MSELEEVPWLVLIVLMTDSRCDEEVTRYLLDLND